MATKAYVAMARASAKRSPSWRLSISRASASLHSPDYQGAAPGCMWRHNDLRCGPFVARSAGLRRNGLQMRATRCQLRSR
jgi:hypothetical protein